VEAFNLSEKYRVPVLVMMDEVVGHMTEKVVIPPTEEIEIQPRRYTKLPPGDFLLYRPGSDLVPDMVRAGDGYRFHVTGLTHDERGYPAASAGAVEAQQRLVSRLVEKIRSNADQLCRTDQYFLDDAEVVLVAYGITARVALRAVQMARERGIKAGLLRPLIIWPFPERRIRELAARPNLLGFVVPELNYGQIVYEVERCAAGKVPTLLVPHAGGTVHKPEEILERVLHLALGGPQSAALQRPLVEVTR
jgi:2-oxoglutarate ferredoxin oxidoreductase subunit alpha